MKRPPKSRKQDPLEANSPRVEPWIGWSWIAPKTGQEGKDAKFSRESSELEWVRQQLEKLIDVFQIDRAHRTTPPAMIVVASASRPDPIDEAIADLSQRFPTAPIRLLLGEWWSGHRRTWPLSSGITSLYWYQCHDVLLPQVMEFNGSLSEMSTQARSAIVVSSDSSIRQMWLEVLPSLGFHPLAVGSCHSLPEGAIEIVILDQVSSKSPALNGLPSETNEDFDDIANEVAILRGAYPHAKIVVCSGFPRWTEVRRCIKSGAGLFVGKPCHWEGIGRVLRSSFSSAALPRR